MFFLCHLYASMQALRGKNTGGIHGVVEILPWTMMQHFSVRTYAQVALCTVWTVARQRNKLDFCERHALLEGCINQVATVESNSTKSVKKLMESFWFSDNFHPIADYIIEVG
ncbi:PREDICTED: probable methyltransferase TARBP1 [Priapulus caudatus]|uniref:Probable methyltransferase TARBP1 n=1 Tax=Priapulus caudatus TaxID=37621 RepID=A0ABM1EZI6_PRICU|nr:PREDICTED: probable methyltransferase TARBP1 [Priapulus caudatus]